MQLFAPDRAKLGAVSCAHMKQVIELIRDGALRDALVRLWVLAGRHENGDRNQNAWERNTVKVRFDQLAAQFGSLLTHGKSIGPVHAAQEPLALIRVLDSFLADEQRAPRKLSVIPHRVDGADYWLVRHPLARRNHASMAGQAGPNRQAWFRHHAVIPKSLGGPDASISIAIGEPDSATSMALEKLLSLDSVRIFVAHFVDGVRLDMQKSVADKLFAIGLTQPDIRRASILDMLDRAQASGAHIVVFPELTVIPAHRQLIAEWRLTAQQSAGAPILIVTGSFHEEVKGRRVNRAELLGLSKPLMTHEKIRPFGKAEGFAEDIASGGKLTLLSTPLGLIAMPICKDYNDVAGGPDWTRIEPDWCLVPSMGDASNVRAHARRAESLWQVVCRAVSAVANQEFDGQPATSGFGQIERKIDITAGGHHFDAPLKAAIGIKTP